MKNEKISIESGSLEKITYTYKDEGVIGIKEIVNDLYKFLPDFKSDVIFIQSIVPNDEFTAGDVVYDYVDKYHEHGLVLTDPIWIDKRLPNLGTTDMINHLDKMAHDCLYESAFMKVIFNSNFFRKFSRIEDVFVYGNEDGHLFVDKYKNYIDHWEASDKII